MPYCFLCSEYFHPTPGPQDALSNSYSMFPHQNKIQTPFQSLQRIYDFFQLCLPPASLFSPGYSHDCLLIHPFRLQIKGVLSEYAPHPQPFSNHIVLFYFLGSTLSFPEILAYSFMSLVLWLLPPECKLFEVRASAFLSKCLLSDCITYPLLWAPLSL